MIRKIPLLKGDDKLRSTVTLATGALKKVEKSPDEGLGDLFAEVQKRRVYSDGKTFVDLIPRKRMKQIRKEYEIERQDPDFDLQEFVNRHFYEFEYEPPRYISNPDHTPREHVQDLWKVLKRRNRIDRGSLVALPYPYIVPGGRFSEQFYWDSYFVMLGLAADNQWKMYEGMMSNYTFMIRKFGFIPTANRTYFLSRSQPPFFSHMVKLLSRHRGRKRTLLEYLPYMLAEYRFWTKGRRRIDEGADVKSYGRVVQMPNGIILARYFDNKTSPRPESQREDIETANLSDKQDKSKLFLDLRAAAESGWDFSSRWFKNPSDIASIHTTDIVPVDLNCLIYHLEMTIAESYQIIFQPLLARRFFKLAEKRAETIKRYMWDSEQGFFMDYDYRESKTTDELTLAGVFPLYVKIATTDQATKVAEKIEQDFLKPGGLLTTLRDTGQQWDAPNGWAPLQWVAIVGLRNYGFHSLADKIKAAWLSSVTNIYKHEGKMVEKYDVSKPGGTGGGGEYPLQDGFGWTNGVLAALLAEDD